MSSPLQPQPSSDPVLEAFLKATGTPPAPVPESSPSLLASIVGGAKGVAKMGIGAILGLPTFAEHVAEAFAAGVAAQEGLPNTGAAAEQVGRDIASPVTGVVQMWKQARDPLAPPVTPEQAAASVSGLALALGSPFTRGILRGKPAALAEAPRPLQGAPDPAGAAFAAKVASETPPVARAAPEASTALVAPPAAAVERGTIPPERLAQVNVTDKPAEGGQINLSHYDLDPDGQQLLQQHTAEAAVRYQLDPKTPIPHEQQRAVAREIYGGNPDALLKAPNRWGAAELLGARDAINGAVNRQVTLAQQLTSDALTDGQRTAMAAEYDGLGRQIQGMLGRGIGDMREAARAVASGNAGARPLDPAYWMFKAARQLGGDEPKLSILPDGVKAHITDLVKAGKADEVQRYVGGLSRGNLGTLALKSFVVNVISSPAIYGKAALSGLTHNALRMADDAVATAGDALWSGITGSARQRSAFNLDMVSAAARGFRQGAKNALSVLRNEPLTDPYGTAVGNLLTRTGHTPVVYDSPLLSAYDRWVNDNVLRSHGAYFALTARIGFERSVVEQARVLAQNEGLRGADFATRVQQLRATPTNEMFVRAAQEGQAASFTSRGTLSSIGSAMRREAVKHGFWPGAAATAMAPVVRIAGNVAEAGLAHSPLGFLSGAWSAAKVAHGLIAQLPAKELAPLQRQMITRFAQAGTGTVGLVGLGYELGKMGYLSGGGPMDAAHRQVLEATGWQANSLRIGQHWHYIGALAPMGTLLTLGATLHEIAAAQQKPVNPLQMVGPTLQQTITQQPLFTGPVSFTQAAQQMRGDQVGAFKRVAGETATGLIPLSGALRRIAQAVDHTVRSPKTVGEQVKTGLPGLSRGVPPSVNWKGEPVTRVGGVQHAFYFGNLSQGKSDPETAELLRLGVGVPRVTQQRAKGETEAQFIQREQATGRLRLEAVRAVMAAPEYAQIPVMVQQAWAANPAAWAEKYPSGVEAAAKDFQARALKDALRRAAAR